MNPLYAIERWPRGWVFVYLGERGGIPINAFPESINLFPKGSVLCFGICSHLKRSGKCPRAILVVCEPHECDAWTAEIATALAIYEPEKRWFLGTDTGNSSCAIFAALAKPSPLQIRAKNETRGETPADASDFGRCRRLVEALDWRNRLPEVAALYPQSKWPRVIDRWDELCAADPETTSALLRQL